MAFQPQHQNIVFAPLILLRGDFISANRLLLLTRIQLWSSASLHKPWPCTWLVKIHITQELLKTSGFKVLLVLNIVILIIGVLSMALMLLLNRHRIFRPTSRLLALQILALRLRPL